MPERLFVDGPMAGEWGNFDTTYVKIPYFANSSFDLPNHEPLTDQILTYTLREAMIPGWRIVLSFYTLHPTAHRLPTGTVLPGYIAGARFESCPIDR